MELQALGNPMGGAGWCGFRVAWELESTSLVSSLSLRLEPECTRREGGLEVTWHADDPAVAILKLHFHFYLGIK